MSCLIISHEFLLMMYVFTHGVWNPIVWVCHSLLSVSIWVVCILCYEKCCGECASRVSRCTYLERIDGGGVYARVQFYSALVNNSKLFSRVIVPADTLTSNVWVQITPCSRSTRTLKFLKFANQILCFTVCGGNGGVSSGRVCSK